MKMPSLIAIIGAWYIGKHGFKKTINDANEVIGKVENGFTQVTKNIMPQKNNAQSDFSQNEVNQEIR